MYTSMLLDEGVCLVLVVVAVLFDCLFVCLLFSSLFVLFLVALVTLLLSDSSPSTKISPEMFFPLQGACQKSPKTQRFFWNTLRYLAARTIITATMHIV